MKKKETIGPTFGSVFAGIGGFDLGLERAGWECQWQIENDEFCNKVLEKHWPDVRRYGDVQEVRTEELELVDLICGGFPCQDLSVAGKRGGLAGERSGLFWEFDRIIRGLRPIWILIENVTGLLSSNKGRDFDTLIEALSECGYGVVWRILDSQHFGVPQKRRRVFIVGHLGAICPPEVLFEREGSQRSSSPSREAQTGIARDTARHPRTGSSIVGTLHARDYKGVGTQYVGESKLVVCEKDDSIGVREAPGVPRWVDEPARYGALGNAITVQVAEWIGERILKVINGSGEFGVFAQGSNRMFARETNVG